MCGKQSLERLAQIRRLPRTLQNFVDLFLVPIGHGGNHGFLVLKVAVDQADADPGLSADIVHAGLVEAAFRETSHRGVEDLGRPVESYRFDLGLRHGTRQ